MKFLKSIIRSVGSTSLYIAPAVLFSLLSVAQDADAAPHQVKSTHSSSHSGAAASNMHSSRQSNMYASVQYYGDFFTHMGTFTGKENATGVTSGDILTYKSNGLPSKSATYDPDYKTDYISGGASLGYSMGYFRFEFEGQYSNIVVDDKDFKTKDDAKYLEIIRKNDNLTGDLTAASELYKENKGAFSVSSEHYNEVQKLSAAAGATPVPLSNKDHLAAKIKNDGMRFIGGFLNMGYDLRVPGFPLVPFVVAGAGLAQTKFLGDTVYGFAYQVKGGVTFHLNNNIAFFAAYDYRGTLSKEYKEVPLMVSIKGVPAGIITPSVPAVGTSGTPGYAPAIPAAQQAPTTAVIASNGVTAENAFGVHGLMAGIKVSF
jgi:opacity protein-like surface antigen